MTSIESGVPSPRISDADRERALGALREGMVDGRLSHDTFERRMEQVMGARRPEELALALRDLPACESPAERTGWLVQTVGRIASFQHRMSAAWRAERLPQLVLPTPGPHPLSIGRAPGSALRLNDGSVSRFHAQLTADGGGWLIRDLGSANGTWVNGRRVTDTLPVRPGDEVRFGAVSYRLSLR
ncbi:FHA domain-containing protein [Streptomyces xiamenensis]